jgi:hypothetical protein
MIAFVPVIYQMIWCIQFTFAYCEKMHYVREGRAARMIRFVQGPGIAARALELPNTIWQCQHVSRASSVNFVDGATYPGRGSTLMNKTRRNQRKRTGPKSTRTTEHLVRALVAGCGSPAHVLELYYWSREPGLTDVIRGIVAMPEETRAALETFMAISRDTKSVVATLDRCGVLSLTSANAMKTVALAQHAAADDVDDQPRLLN